MAALHELYKNALLDDPDDVEIELDAVTAAEESYGEDYAWYGASSVEDDDEETVQEIEAEQGVVFAGDDEDDLEAEIDQDLYGYDLGGLQARFEATGMTAPQMAALQNAIGVGMVMPTSAQGGNIETFFEFVHQTLTGGDIGEIATYIAVQPNVQDWQSLSHDEKYEIVSNAISSSAVPGMEFHADDAFWQSYADSRSEGWGSFVSALSGAKSAAVSYFTDDMPTFIESVLSEIPGLSQIAIDKISKNPDEAVNGVAFAYLMLHLASKQLGPEYDTYNWLITAIDKMQNQIFPAVAAPETEAVSVSVPKMSDILPPLSLSRGPRPQDILAGGVILMNALAMLGVK